MVFDIAAALGFNSAFFITFVVITTFLIVLFVIIGNTPLAHRGADLLDDSDSEGNNNTSGGGTQAAHGGGAHYIGLLSRLPTALRADWLRTYAAHRRGTPKVVARPVRPLCDVQELRLPLGMLADDEERRRQQQQLAHTVQAHKLE